MADLIIAGVSSPQEGEIGRNSGLQCNGSNYKSWKMFRLVAGQLGSQTVGSFLTVLVVAIYVITIYGTATYRS